MKITKFLHSCLLVAEQDITCLFDPGNFSESALDVNSIDKLDYILITHSHPDHLYLPLLKNILNKFPNAKIITNQSIKDILAKEQIVAQTNGNENIFVENVKHEHIWMGPPPENTMITIFGKFAHPGDSLSFETTAPIIALPITAPWGHTTWAVEKARELKPQIIIPIHDWMWKEEFTKGMYNRLEQDFAAENIKFLKPETGKTLEI